MQYQPWKIADTSRRAEKSSSNNTHTSTVANKKKKIWDDFSLLHSFYCSMCPICLPLPQANFLQGTVKLSSWQETLMAQVNSGESVGGGWHPTVAGKGVAVRRQRCVAAAEGPCCRWLEVRATLLPRFGLSCWPCRLGEKVFESLYECVALHREEDSGSLSLLVSRMNWAPGGHTRN